jgi:predicted nucleotidyltransferase
MNRERPDIPKDLIREFCRKHRIRKLSVFGSYLREYFGPESVIEFLVEFEKGRTPGYIDRVEINEELSEVLGGYDVDLQTPKDVRGCLRDEIMAEAVVLYAKE